MIFVKLEVKTNETTNEQPQQWKIRWELEIVPPGLMSMISRSDELTKRQSVTMTMGGGNGANIAQRVAVFGVICETLRENYPGLKYTMGCCCCVCCESECNIEPMWDWIGSLYSTSNEIRT